MKKITGIPEWTPQEKLLEARCIELIKFIFKSNGYVEIETGAFERVAALESKGEIDKEIFYIANKNNPSKYALHYDLTVPFARYVSQNFNSLEFPFKRFQIQKVWRGETPQKGRFREFYQCDLDVIGNDKLSPFYDVEVLHTGNEALSCIDWKYLSPEYLNTKPYTIYLNNKKVLDYFLKGIGINDITSIVRLIDKSSKIGIEAAINGMAEFAKSDQIEKITNLIEYAQIDSEKTKRFILNTVENEQLVKGLNELDYLYNQLVALGNDNFKIDYSLARGFDYYTGNIFEGKMNDSKLGSICAGGRYDNLAERFINKHLPGVGFSIGLSRIFSEIVKSGNIDLRARPKAIILRTREDDLTSVFKLRNILFEKGFSSDIYPDFIGISKQFKYANKLGYTNVWIEAKDKQGVFEMKDMTTGKQEQTITI